MVLGYLVDWQIDQAVSKGSIFLQPFYKQNIQSNSYDVTLGNSFIAYLPQKDSCGAGKEFPADDHIVDPYDQASIDYIHNHPRTQEFTSDWVVIYPGMFLLATTNEYITLADNMVAKIEGKSSLARLGIEIHQTGGWIDAGFRGQITLEITNALTWPVRLYAGMAIAQLAFVQTEPCEFPYNKRDGAKYNNQQGATRSRYALNKPRIEV